MQTQSADPNPPAEEYTIILDVLQSIHQALESILKAIEELRPADDLPEYEEEYTGT